MPRVGFPQCKPYGLFILKDSEKASAQTCCVWNKKSFSIPFDEFLCVKSKNIWELLNHTKVSRILCLTYTFSFHYVSSAAATAEEYGWSYTLFWERSAFGNALFRMEPNTVEFTADRDVCTDRGTSDIAVGKRLNVS